MPVTIRPWNPKLAKPRERLPGNTSLGSSQPGDWAYTVRWVSDQTMGTATTAPLATVRRAVGRCPSNQGTATTAKSAAAAVTS